MRSNWTWKEYTAIAGVCFVATMLSSIVFLVLVSGAGSSTPVNITASCSLTDQENGSCGFANGTCMVNKGTCAFDNRGGGGSICVELFLLNNMSGVMDRQEICATIPANESFQKSFSFAPQLEPYYGFNYSVK